MHDWNYELTRFLLHPIHHFLEEGMPDVSDYMCPLDTHHEATILVTEDIHISKVLILEGIDELEGMWWV